jgi:prepilin-type N-terminal cleavage/methylation domain-containing protein/prepilin-type processing-associated H-X9-DG protein
MAALQYRRTGGRRAFTLVELLVVIGVLALLAAILLPVLASARGRARSATCQQQLRQMAVALKMYAENHDGVFPPLEHWGTGVVRLLGVHWFYCPATRHLDPNPGLTYLPGYVTAGYAYNGFLAGFPFDPRTGPPVPLRLADVLYPATTVVIGDCRLHIFNLDRPDVDQSPLSPNWGEEGGRRHLGGANYAFLDGHVHWYRPEQVRGATHSGGPDGKTPDFRPR